ncbi:MAG TPA: pseudouridine synthase, partial [Thermoanaerobaculia bacterium]
MSEERLQKILARAGVTSRRKAEELIRDGRVTVNGEPADLGGKADPARDVVKLDGRRVQPPSVHRYLLLNKPRAVMSTVEDPGGRPTVIDLVPQAYRKALFPVGRLDFETEGLILLTDDGDFAQQVAHPRYGCRKTYEVKVKGRPEEDDLDRLRAGIVLEGRRTAPAVIRPRRVKTTAARRRARGQEGDGDNSWWVVELGEGRTRQIREMFLRIGHPVQKLRRVAIGPLSDATLPLGAVRELRVEEVEALRRAAQAVQVKDAAKGGKGKETAKGGKARAAAPGRSAGGERSEKLASPAHRPAATRSEAKRPPLAAGRKSPVAAASVSRDLDDAFERPAFALDGAFLPEVPARRPAGERSGHPVRSPRPAARPAKPGAKRPAGRATAQAGARSGARSETRRPPSREASGRPGLGTAGSRSGPRADSGRPPGRKASDRPASAGKFGRAGKPSGRSAGLGARPRSGEAGRPAPKPSGSRP